MRRWERRPAATSEKRKINAKRQTGALCSATVQVSSWRHRCKNKNSMGSFTSPSDWRRKSTWRQHPWKVNTFLVHEPSIVAMSANCTPSWAGEWKFCSRVGVCIKSKKRNKTRAPRVLGFVCGHDEKGGGVVNPRKIYSEKKQRMAPLEMACHNFSINFWASRSLAGFAGENRCLGDKEPVSGACWSSRDTGKNVA